MDQDQLSPEESLNLISNVISEARSRFQEDGIIYMMWGILLSAAGIGQYLLIYFEYYSINYFPYFVMPVGGIVSYFYYKKKAGAHSKNAISILVGRLWIIILINLLVLGFFFSIILEEHLVPVILIILGIGSFISGIAIRERILQIASLCINILGFATFFISYEFHPLITAATGIFFTLIPGIIISKKNRS